VEALADQLPQCHISQFEDRPSQSTRYPDGMTDNIRRANPFKRSGSKSSSSAGAAGAFVGPDGTVVDKESVNGGWRQKLHLRKKTTEGGASEDGDGTVAAVDGQTADSTGDEVQHVAPAAEEVEQEEEEEETPSLNFPVTIILMCEPPVAVSSSCGRANLTFASPSRAGLSRPA
jgi:hypothetical protein